MSDVEEQVRKFILEGSVPVPPAVGMIDRVDRGLRARRRRTAVVAGVVAIGALVGVGGAIAAYPKAHDNPVASDRSTRPASSPNPDCAGVRILAAGTSTDKNASGSRALALVLAQDDRQGPGCTLESGMQIQLQAAKEAATATVPATLGPVALGPGEAAGIELTWSNWCSNRMPRASVIFGADSRTDLTLPGTTPTPDCTNPGSGSRLVVSALQKTEVDPAPSAPANS